MVIEVKQLVKNYKNVNAVKGVSFSVSQGEIFGMVGPNGAGKTSVIECIEGLREPDGGSVRVLGLDPVKDRKKLNEIIGVQLQETSFHDKIRVWEICKLFSSMYEKPVSYEKLLDEFGLSDKKKSFVSKLSGGQKQRLSIVLALIPDPKIVFLDELTTGLDPQARRAMWDLIRSLKKEDRTIFLTTHYMEEVENLCDRVLVMDNGEIIALDTVANLINSSGIAETVSFTSLAKDFDSKLLMNIEGVITVDKDGDNVTLVGNNSDLLMNTINFLQKAGHPFSNIMNKKPNLEDVFLKLTGKKTRD